MGLIFLSNRSGHDEEAGRPPDGRGRRGDDGERGEAILQGRARARPTSTPTAISSAAGCSARWTSPPASSPRARRTARWRRWRSTRWSSSPRSCCRDLVSVYARVERIGRTSIAIRIEVVASRDRGREEVKVTEGLFTFVALDDAHQPRPVKQAGLRRSPASALRIGALVPAAAARIPAPFDGIVLEACNRRGSRGRHSAARSWPRSRFPAGRSRRWSRRPDRSSARSRYSRPTDRREGGRPDCRSS